MEKIRLQRHGQQDLFFQGERLSHVDERDFYGFSEDWMETSLYRTSLGGYIVHNVTFITSCGQRNIPIALIFPGAKDLLAFMEVNTRPLSPLTAELLRQASLLDDTFHHCGTYMPITLYSPGLTAKAS